MKHSIKITRSLLKKDPSSLTADELAAVKDYKDIKKRQMDMLDEVNHRIASECSILCSGHEHVPVPDYGWITPVERLCYQLEDMNLRYAKYGIRVVMDQSKEKFGYLRFYTHVDVDPVGLIGFVVKPLNWMINALSTLDFKYKTVVDSKLYNTIEWREISKTAFDERKNEYGTRLEEFARAVEVIDGKDKAILQDALHGTVYLTELDGKYLYSYVLCHPARTHRVPTRHKIARCLLGRIEALKLWVLGFYKESMKQRVFSHKVDLWADELVAKAEDECGKICQICGNTFHDYQGMRKCETQGWYTYICEKCAVASGRVYKIGESTYLEGEKVETKKEVENEK